MTAARFEMLPVKDIRESPLQYRRTYPDSAELVESVRKAGILSPVLVRPVDSTDGWELVFGHRRLRAAKEAGLTEIPATIRDLTDTEVLEAQLVENCQRSDVHPLEEADAFQALHEKHGFSVEDLAIKIGKSASHIYQRLKLCSLCEGARQAFFAGELLPTIAVYLARIPDSAHQEEATREVLDQRMSAREASEHIQRLYMLRLSEAPWSMKDADLVPSAGPCSTCPKRTGNQAELFNDVPTGNVCSDPKCFESKRVAYWAIEKVKAAEKGVKVLEGEEARKADAYGSGYVDLDDRQYVYGLNMDNEKELVPAKLLGKAAAPTVLAQMPNGEVKRLISREQLVEQLKESKSDDAQALAKELARKEQSYDGGGSGDSEAKKRKAYDARKKVVPFILEALWTKLIGENPSELLEAELRSELQRVQGKALLVALGMEESKDPAAELVEVGNGAAALVMARVASGGRNLVGSMWSSDYDPFLATTAKKYGVDIKAIERKMKEDTKKAEAEKKSGKGKTKASADEETGPGTRDHDGLCLVPGCTEGQQGGTTSVRKLCRAHALMAQDLELDLSKALDKKQLWKISKAVPCGARDGKGPPCIHLVGHDGAHSNGSRTWPGMKGAGDHGAGTPSDSTCRIKGCWRPQDGSYGLCGVHDQKARRMGLQVHQLTPKFDKQLAAPFPDKFKDIEERTCRECGCTEQDGCPDHCSWVAIEIDDIELGQNLCSNCQPPKQTAKAPKDSPSKELLKSQLPGVKGATRPCIVPMCRHKATVGLKTSSPMCQRHDSKLRRLVKAGVIDGEAGWEDPLTPEQLKLLSEDGRQKRGAA